MIDFDDLDGAEEAREEEEAPLRAAREAEAIATEEAEHWVARVAGAPGDAVQLFGEPDMAATPIGTRLVGDTLRLVQRHGDFALLHPLELARVATDYQDYWHAVLKNEVPRRNDSVWIQTSRLETVAPEQLHAQFKRCPSQACDRARKLLNVPSASSTDVGFADAISAVSDALTIIISTSPAQHHCNAEILLQALRSLQANKALTGCRKLLVFDASPSDEEQKIARDKGAVAEGGAHWVPQVDAELAAAYKGYQDKLKSAAKMGNKAMAGVELLFMPKWGHLVGTVEFALQHISTPFVLLHQHDLVVAETFTPSHVVSILRVLAQEKANYVILNRDVNFASRSTQYFQAAPHRLDLWRTFVRKHSLQLDDEAQTTLTPFIGFSDQTHFARADWMRECVLPMVGSRKCCMEFAVYEKMLLSWLHNSECWERTYMLGGMRDGPFIYDMDKNGNKWALSDDAYADDKVDEMYVDPDDLIVQPGRPFWSLALYVWTRQSNLPSRMECLPDRHGEQNRICFEDFDLRSTQQFRRRGGLFYSMG